MSVPYGRYTVTFDREEGMWNADPKARAVIKNGTAHSYTYPESKVFIEPTKGKMLQKMREEGAKQCRVRRGEWIVYMDTDNDQEEK